jgi:hypothetical protein
VTAKVQSAQRQLKAYTVLEEFENTGGIVFARHAVTARRLGADRYAEGNFSLVTCRRAKWADGYAETGIVPASGMVWDGWHFECHYCGARIDRDLEPFKGWTPDHVIGRGEGLVFCHKGCQAAHDHESAFAERLKVRTFAHYAQKLARRFPGITVRPIGYAVRSSHVYVNGGRIKQVVIDFDWPGQKIGPAAFRWDSNVSGGKGFTCCFGDKEAFEAFVAGSKKAA